MQKTSYRALVLGVHVYGNVCVTTIKYIMYKGQDYIAVYM